MIGLVLVHCCRRAVQLASSAHRRALVSWSESCSADFEWLTVELILHRVEGFPLAVQAAAPLVGLAIATLLLRTVGQGASNSTSDEYINSYHARNPELPERLLLPRLLAGTATIGSGGALGLKGPAIYTGSVLGLSIHKRIEGIGSVNDAARLLLTAGAAAGVAAIFQAPATGVLFALEAPYRDDLAHRALLPALIASAASYLTFISMPFIARSPSSDRSLLATWGPPNSSGRWQSGSGPASAGVSTPGSSAGRKDSPRPTTPCGWS